jgi:CBS domain-containing protein
MINSESPIKELMTTNVFTVSPDDRLMKANKIFDEKGFHHLLVVNENELVGILSKTDLLNYLWNAMAAENIVKSSDILIKDLMTHNPITIDCDDTIGLAADIFLSNKLHSLPVLDGEELVGVITSYDLLKFTFT